VKNFQKLVMDKFYDGLTVYRVVKGFAIQSGDPNGDGSGGSDATVPGEFTSNGVRNDLSHILGVISMARKADGYNSATSQFMICNSDTAAESLDTLSAAFGYVVAGMEVILTVSEVEVTLGSGEVSRPVEPILIEKICFVYKK
jgi:peptidyl-prolyl cis-trans isomerase B (cyclophilin B)